MKKTYRVHFDQMNQIWLEIEASSRQAAINRASREIRQYFPEPDYIEMPNGKQESLEYIYGN